MVRAIVETSDGRNFWGTRSAGYNLPFVYETDVNIFADDLEKNIIKINNQRDINKDISLILKNQGKKVEIGRDESRLKDDLRYALNGFQNVQIIFEPYDKVLANLVARFSRDSPHKNRLLEIYPIGIPNKFFWFNPSFLYELGEKHGFLERGEDFDIKINNYRKINIED